MLHQPLGNTFHSLAAIQPSFILKEIAWVLFLFVFSFFDNLDWTIFCPSWAAVSKFKYEACMHMKACVLNICLN